MRAGVTAAPFAALSFPAMTLRSLAPLALPLLLAGACSGTGRERAAAAQATPAAAEVREVDVVELRRVLDSLHGKVVLVNVWASWCLPCATELAELDTFARDYRDRDIQVLAISVDDPATKDRSVVPFIAERRPGFRVLLRAAGPEAPFRELLDASWDGTIPASFVFDREGRLRKKLVGAQKREGFEQAVAPLVGSPHPRGER